MRLQNWHCSLSKGYLFKILWNSPLAHPFWQPVYRGEWWSPWLLSLCFTKMTSLARGRGRAAPSVSISCAACGGWQPYRVRTKRENTAPRHFLSSLTGKPCCSSPGVRYCVLLWFSFCALCKNGNNSEIIFTDWKLPVTVWAIIEQETWRCSHH